MFSPWPWEVRTVELLKISPLVKKTGSFCGEAKRLNWEAKFLAQRKNFFTGRLNFEKF